MNENGMTQAIMEYFAKQRLRTCIREETAITPKTKISTTVWR